MGGNIAERGGSPSGSSTVLASSFSLTGGTTFKCDNQIDATSSSERAREEPDFPMTRRVRSTGIAADFGVTAVEFNKAIWASRVTTRL